jgi:hypothetical protein
MLTNIQFRNILSSHLLSKNVKIKIYIRINLLVVLYESLVMREEHD